MAMESILSPYYSNSVNVRCRGQSLVDIGGDGQCFTSVSHLQGSATLSMAFAGARFTISVSILGI